MKKNYLSKTAMSANLLALIVAKKSWKNMTTTWLLFLFTVFGFTDALGQGNTCASAVSVNVNTEYTAFSVTDNIVNDPTQGAVNGQTMQRDGWFSFVSNGTEASIRVEAGNRNPMIFAYSGACGGLTLIGSVNANTGTGGHTEVLNLTGLTNGATYYVRVGNSTNNNMPLSSFHILTNDRCANAFMLTSNTSCTTTSGSTVGATDNNETGDCTTGTENAVWYQFQAVATTHVVTVDGAVGFDPVIQVLNTCGVAGNPTGGGCVDATGNGGIETLTLTGLTVGNFYKIQIHDWQGDLMANGFTICVTHTSPPTITSFTPSSACASSSQTVVITGTNFTGATAVTIGGTAAASYVVNSATQITATIGTGATGTIQVTTPGGSATSTTNFTVNPLPANPGNPTSNSPQCNPPGVTLTRTGTPPAGVTWYWQTVAGGTSTANSGATFVATTGGTYYLRAQNNTTGCWSAGSGSVAITITPSLSAVAGTPAPTNAATGVCYSGTGAVTSISWGAVAGATSYDVYFGAGSVPVTVTANVTTNTYNTGALAANTTYYWRIVAKNACGDAPTSATFSFTTSGSTCYCASSGSTFSNGISGVNFNTINNLNTAVNVAYRDYTYLSTTVVKTLSYNLNVYVTSATGWWSNTNYQSVYIDWNGDGDFVDAGEFYNLGTATNVTNGLTSLSPLSITVPAGAITGSVRMRIQSRYGAATTGPCQTGFDGEVEDYMLNILAATPCTTPTAQPTALNLTAGGSIISGSFTASVPAANSYLVIIGTSATPPAAPVNGTNYTIGSVYQAGGYTVVDIDNNTTFAATGLGASTPYYFYIYSYNNLCTGGPLYLGTSPLSGTATTTALTYCEPTTTLATEFITGIASVGTINDVSNTSGYSPGGYANYSSIIIATQIPGGGININLSLTDITTSERQFVRTWVDWNNDGDFDDTGELVYTTGNTATGTTSYGFLVPVAQALGDYRMRIKTRNYGDSSSYNSCDSYARGETEDYTIRVIADCPAKITGITPGSACGPTNTVTLSATMSAGSTQIRWYDALTGGTLVGTGASFTTPILSSSTTYYVTASNGSCETIHRTPIKATILSTTNITITPSVPEVCGENNVVSISALGDNITEIIHTQDFESGLSGYTINTIGDTTPTSGTAPDAPWSIKTSPYPTTTNIWKPAINSGPIGTVGNQFAFTTSDYSGTDFTTTITSPAINVSSYSSLTLTFDHFFSRYVDDLGTIEASTDNGATWSTVNTFTAKDGSASKFKSVLFNLTPYTGVGVTQLRIRFVYYGSYDDGWAIDNIKLEGVRPLNTLFTWTGATIAAFADAACTVPYTNQPVTTVYVKPTPSQLAMPSWSFTANATLGNGCIISTPVTITNKTKLWKGTTDNNWYNPNNWEPTGIPDANTCVYIYPGSPAANTSNINTIANDAFAKVVTVRPSGVLNIHPNNDLTVTDAVTVDAGGTFNIENTGSLIQVNNVANSGIISMKRNASFGALDYVYWSSPVANFASSAISPATPTSLIWKWEPTTSTSYTNQFGNWVNGNETMTIGRGYIVRSPNGWPTANTTFTANFVGVPNNGTITRPITRWTWTTGNTPGPTTTTVTPDDDNWNLLGNPYPSAIDAIAFLNANATHINGFVDLWTHGNAPAAIADPFYQDYQLNYNTNDYLRYNTTGGTQFGFDGKIGAGQGFFVLMRDAGSTTENAVFTNAMRSRTHRNDQFYRTSETNEVTSEIERHRIWLKMVAPNLVSTDMLVGYVAGATNSLDDSFDAMNRGIKVNYELYSLAENQGLLIQGRSLPFDTNDRIPLGMAISQNGIHTIAINGVDGLFTGTTQPIYLEDLVLGITHDLRTAPYTFTAAPGRYENRFVLKFNNETLGNEDFIANNVTVYTNESINISAPNQVIKSVRVHDLLGRVLGTFNNVNSNTFSSKNIAKTQSPLLVEVTLENGATKTYKVIF